VIYITEMSDLFHSLDIGVMRQRRLPRQAVRVKGSFVAVPQIDAIRRTPLATLKPKRTGATTGARV